jgi:hypothetical protein
MQMGVSLGSAHFAQYGHVTASDCGAPSSAPDTKAGSRLNAVSVLNVSGRLKIAR